MNNSIELFKINKLDDLIGIDKYVSHMDKWYNNLKKLFILSLEGNNGTGKSILANLFLENKGYNVLYFDIATIKTKTHIFDKIKESFKTFDICSILQNKKKKIRLYNR